MKNINIHFDKCIYFVVITCIILALLQSCSDNKSDEIVSTKKDFIELSDESINILNSMFSRIDFMDTVYIFENGHFFNPDFNRDFIVEFDTMNYVYLKLFEKSDSIVLGVNKLRCYATILPKFEGKYYPNESVIYPYDFSFLNQNEPLLNINCKNDDDENYRMVGYYKGLIGSWSVDSILTHHKEYITDISIETLQFSKENVIINDLIKADYVHSGYTIELEEFPFDFYKIFLNENKMILINTYKDSHEIFYLSKLNE